GELDRLSRAPGARRGRVSRRPRGLRASLRVRTRADRAMTRRDDDFARKFETVLRAHLRFLQPGTPLAADDALGTLGLDSMAAIDLLLDLERTFGVHIPDDLLNAETFETLASLEATFRPLLEASIRPAGE